jgi:DNA polymerase I
MGLDLDCYDLHWTRRGPRLALQALVDGPDGKELMEMPPPFAPYCYIEEDGYAKRPFAHTSASLGAGAPEGYFKVEFSDPGDMRDFDDLCNCDTYEADVHFNQRVAVDCDVTFERPDRDDVLYFDIEVDDRGGFEHPEDAGSRVVAIAGVGGDGRELYFDDDDERELLRGFLEAADDYVALAGWNSVDYDFRYLEERCAGLGMSVEWRRWVRHDVMPLYDMLATPTKTVSTKLDDTAERELGEGKAGGVDPGDGEVWEAWSERPDELREYNIRDADLVRRIDEQYDLVELLHVICDLCSYPPGEALYLTKHDQVKFAIGQVVDSKVLEVASRRGLPQPNKRSAEKPDDFPGGYVLEPEPGMYDWLVVPDYSGMYPNIVRSWNFGCETWVPDSDMVHDSGEGAWYINEGQWEGCRAIKGESGGFVHPDDGMRSVPAEAADELVEMREGAADIVDNGVKAVNNCYPKSTKILTPDRGRVPVEELEAGDRVYSINPETQECEVKPVVETVAEPNAYGELVNIDCQAADLKVTPNHNMLVKNRRNNGAELDFHDAEEMLSSRWDFPDHKPIGGRRPETISLLSDYHGTVCLEPRENAQSFRTGCHMCEWDYDKHKQQYLVDCDDFVEHEERLRELAEPVGVQAAPKHSTNPFEYFTGNLLELMGWYVAEGHKVEGRSRVQISQVGEHRERISSLLDDMDIEHSSDWQHVGFNDENLAEWLASECGSGSGKKRIPDWVFELDHALLERLHESLMLGDGSNTSSSAPVYVTTSEQLREDFGRLLTHLGEVPRFKIREAREDAHSDRYEIRPNSARFVDSADHVSREEHDGMVYCVSVLDNHTVLAGRNGTMQWTGQTLYGVFASDFHRYFGPHSENITLVGQELTGKVEEIAGEGHPDIRKVVYGDTDSVMIDMDVPAEAALDDAVAAAGRIVDDVEREMRGWADGLGAFSEYLELDVDDVYDRFYIGDRKKRYFGHRVYKDGEPADGLKVRGFETRQGDWPRPVRDFQEELMRARLSGDPTGPIIDEAREALFSGRWDLEMDKSTKLGQPVADYEHPQPHTRAAEQLRERFGEGAVQVGDKVRHIKYGPGRTDVTWVRDGELGEDFRPNEAWCPECGEVVRDGGHPHDTADGPRLRDRHYSYLWENRFEAVMASIGVTEHEQAGLGDFG